MHPRRETRVAVAPRFVIPTINATDNTIRAACIDIVIRASSHGGMVVRQCKGSSKEGRAAGEESAKAGNGAASPASSTVKVNPSGSGSGSAPLQQLGGGLPGKESPGAAAAALCSLSCLTANSACVPCRWRGGAGVNTDASPRPSPVAVQPERGRDHRSKGRTQGVSRFISPPLSRPLTFPIYSLRKGGSIGAKADRGIPLLTPHPPPPLPTSRQRETSWQSARPW
ncbi:unnamed protein product [Closterium sp. NIES-64]|nr:unnamed protein product [Closterium sp. NIES-64]